jgi:DNA-binding PadR family transcriptional regulator
MPRAKTNYKGLVTRQQATSALVDDPPLGHLQALVLHKLATLGRDAYGFKVLESLSGDAGVWLDAPDVYLAIRKLVGKDLIKLVETRSQGGGAPVKVYEITVAGEAALKITTAHHRAVADQLERQEKGG